MALLHGEYRESVDVDFLVSDRTGHQRLRHLVREHGFDALAPGGMTARTPIVDGYGIRTIVVVDDTAIKFEIVHEGRIELDTPRPEGCILGVRHLSAVDQVSTKLLANDDRWADPSVFSRDLIDLAMMRPNPRTLEQGVAKAVGAYGDAVISSVHKAVEHLRANPGRVDDIVSALNMSLPRAAVFAAVVRLSEADALHPRPPRQRTDDRAMPPDRESLSPESATGHRDDPGTERDASSRPHDPGDADLIEEATAEKGTAGDAQIEHGHPEG